MIPYFCEWKHNGDPAGSNEKSRRYYLTFAKQSNGNLERTPGNKHTNNRKERDGTNRGEKILLWDEITIIAKFQQKLKFQLWQFSQKFQYCVFPDNFYKSRKQLSPNGPILHFNNLSNYITQQIFQLLTGKWHIYFFLKPSIIQHNSQKKTPQVFSETMWNQEPSKDKSLRGEPSQASKSSFVCQK